eukprot:jgi/Orpsp1_1/1181933/evm.model.c7180000079186.1
MVVTRLNKRLRNEIIEEEIVDNIAYTSSSSSESSPVPSILKKLKKKNSLKLKKKVKKPKTVFEEVDIRDKFKIIENSKFDKNYNYNNDNDNNNDSNNNNNINKNNKFPNFNHNNKSVIEINNFNEINDAGLKNKNENNENLIKKKNQQNISNKQDNYRRALLKKQIFKSRVVDTFKPFNIADSPVLKRSVDLRNTMVRRSSMNLRGKRKSSAYGGLCPPPLPNTRSSSFYRFIAFEQPEPIKMKQLLLWCAERTMQEQNNNDQNKKEKTDDSNSIPKSIADKAKEIQEELMEELMCNKIEISWYNREKSPDEEERLKGKNKINIDNEKKLIEFQEKLEKY